MPRVPAAAGTAVRPPNPRELTAAPSQRPPDVRAEVRPDGQTLGFYVHVPYCRRRCPYCSFATAPLAAGALDRYLGTLGRELDHLAALPWVGRVRLDTVFLGGGTPSLLAPAALAEILERLRAGFRVAPEAEVTVECNPESVTRASLAAYRRAGVNRVSLGVQSLDDAVLARLGRRHDARGARAAFAAARAAGFANVSVDLIYGLPGLTLDAWARTVDAVLAWEPDHLSAYALTLDAGSRWAAGVVDGLPPEETVVAQYWALARAAGARGLEHYEISNYARPGRRCRHNLNYWRAGEYLAAGPAAAAHVGGVRWTAAAAVERWAAAVEAGASPVESHERLTPRQRRAERLVLGLRTADGVPAAWLAARAESEPTLARRLAAWRAGGLLTEIGDAVRLTEAGFLVSDALFVHLL